MKNNTGDLNFTKCQAIDNYILIYLEWQSHSDTGYTWNQRLAYFKVDDEYNMYYVIEWKWIKSNESE